MKLDKDKLLKDIGVVIDKLNPSDSDGISAWFGFEEWIKNYSPKPEKIVIDWIKLRDFFNQATGKSIRVVNDTVKKKIKARIREGYTKDDIISCIKNSVKDEYHIETNLMYITLEYISRNTTIDKYLTDPSIKKDGVFKQKEGTYTK